MRVRILDIPVDQLAPDELSVRLDALRRSSRNLVVTLNPEILMAARANPTLRSAIEDAALVVPDGVGLQLATRYLGLAPKARVPGIDLFSRLIAESVERHERVFLLGGQRGVAVEAAENIRRKYPRVTIVGTDTEIRFWGGHLTDKKLCQRIRRAQPDLLFAGFGSPKQEIWLKQHVPHLPSVKIGMGIGGTLDVYAGRVRRAPVLFRRVGFEWTWRLLTQPWRIQRIFTATIRFSIAVLFTKPKHSL